MNRPRFGRVLASLCALAALRPVASRADDPPKPVAEPKVVSLTVDPQAAPTPALRLRLLPTVAERTEGDAAPVYLRLEHELSTQAHDDINAKTNRWLDAPLAQVLQNGEARAYVKMWGNKLQQIEFGSRRRACHWDYTIPEQREQVISILLPDAQGLRRWGRLLGLKVRVEIAEHHFEEAVRNLQTGLALAEHVGEGPFLINALVGVAHANLMFNQLETMLGEPGAPNLYWALTALPRPLISFRDQAELELTLGRWMLPELTDLDRPQTEGEWAARLSRLHARLVRFEAEAREMAKSQGANAPQGEPLASLPDLAQFQAESLPDARKFLESQPSPATPASDAEAVVRYLAFLEATTLDDEAKGAALPIFEAGPYYDEAQHRILEAKRGPLRSLFASLGGLVLREPLRAQARLDRRVAVLRVIEALRLHAAATGRLPASLEEVKDVPIPSDPLTGKALGYQLDGDTAVLPAPSGFPANTASTYRITLRH